jgi:hypothetical protein
MTQPITNSIKEGDWVVCGLKIGQIKQIRDGSCASFSDGMFELSGSILDRCRPLTLRNKQITETFDYYYDQVRKIDGSSGFNFPDINRYFEILAVTAIDLPDEENKQIYEKAQNFLREAEDYKPFIDAVKLFRRAA